MKANLESYIPNWRKNMAGAFDSNGMKTILELDASNRIVLSRELRRAAGISRKQKLVASATPGRIVLEIEANTSGRIVKRGKLKVWTGAVPSTSIAEAVKTTRRTLKF